MYFDDECKVLTSTEVATTNMAPANCKFIIPDKEEYLCFQIFIFADSGMLQLNHWLALFLHWFK
jgi:hypothetical protein